MDELDGLAARFEASRPRLRAVAYRMLGSRSEADDAVQEAWLRLSRADAGGVDNLGGWLTTVVARVCLDMLRSRESRREEPLPRHGDPVAEHGDAAAIPSSEAMLADSVGLAMLVVLDTLGPAERVAFVLHDMFDLPFDEIAPIVGRSPAAARQLASRARRRVRGDAGGTAAPICAAAAKSWTRFWPPPATATSRHCSRCSIRTWCSAPTKRLRHPECRGNSRAPPRSPGRD